VRILLDAGYEIAPGSDRPPCCRDLSRNAREDGLAHADAGTRQLPDGGYGGRSIDRMSIYAGNCSQSAIELFKIIVSAIVGGSFKVSDDDDRFWILEVDIG